MQNAVQAAVSAALQTVIRRVQIAAIDYRSNSTLRYLQRCAPDGLHRSLNLDRFRAELAELEVQRALLAPPLSKPARHVIPLRPRLLRLPRINAGPALGLAAVVAPWLLGALAYLAL